MCVVSEENEVKREKVKKILNCENSSDPGPKHLLPGVTGAIDNPSRGH